MTPEEFLDEMKGLVIYKDGRALYDPERVHVDADDLMCRVLRELGYSEGVDFFESLDLWYA